MVIGYQDSIRVSLQIAPEPTAPETLVLGKTSHGDHSSTTTLLLPHLSNLGHLWCWDEGKSYEEGLCSLENRLRRDIIAVYSFNCEGKRRSSH